MIIKDYLIEKNITDVLLEDDNLESLNIFGAGDIAKNLLDKSSIQNKINNIEIFDNNPNKIGTMVNGIKIKKPDEILNNDYKIYISVAQSYDEIHSSLIKLNVDKKRIVSGLFL